MPPATPMPVTTEARPRALGQPAPHSRRSTSIGATSWPGGSVSAASGPVDPDFATLAECFAAVPQVDPRSTALPDRCRVLVVVDDDTAISAFESALTAHAAAPDAFERARTELMLGSRLRRSGRRRAARDGSVRAR